MHLAFNVFQWISKLICYYWHQWNGISCARKQAKAGVKSLLYMATLSVGRKQTRKSLLKYAYVCLTGMATLKDQINMQATGYIYFICYGETLYTNYWTSVSFIPRRKSMWDFQDYLQEVVSFLWLSHRVTDNIMKALIRGPQILAIWNPCSESERINVSLCENTEHISAPFMTNTFIQCIPSTLSTKRRHILSGDSSPFASHHLHTHSQLGAI